MCRLSVRPPDAIIYPIPDSIARYLVTVLLQVFPHFLGDLPIPLMENTGVPVLTKVYDPKVTRIAAYFDCRHPSHYKCFIRSFQSIIGGVSLILYGMISAIACVMSLKIMSILRRVRI